MNLSRYIPESLQAQVAELVDSVVSEFETNERLKWIMLGGIFVLYLSFVIFLANRATDARIGFISAQNQLTRLTSQTLETGWAERAETAETLVKRLDGQYWPGETTGLVEAGFERWIRQTLEQHGIDVRQVLLTRGPALEDQSEFIEGPLSSSLKVRAKVIAPLVESGLIRFLDDAAANSSWVIVEQLIIRSGRNPRFEMDLATFSRTGDAQQ